MKRTIAIVVGVATLGAGVYLASQVWAQQSGGGAVRPATPPLQSKIALVNLGQVIKNYNKFKNYQEELKKFLEPVQKEMDAKKGQIIAKETLMNKPETPQAQRDQLQKEIKTMQFEMQTRIDELNSKRSQENVKLLQTIYKDVEDAVAAYARAYAIELVLQYSDPVEPTERLSAPILQQKLANNACFPVFMDPRMNITEPVIQMLNQHMMTKAGGTQP
ncbi:MAG TPA: OmpH family outer membrane protein [Gemmataceae bacterium]|nr:OmpH family outer membrane protein [Gemmataceae bacterium]